MQHFYDWWNQLGIMRHMLPAETERYASKAFDAAARPRDQEIERLEKRLAALEAAVDEVLIAEDYRAKHDSTRQRGDLEIAIDRLRAARGQHTGG